MENRVVIQRVLDRIEENLRTELTAAELARSAGFSLYHFYRLFQAVMGMPVMQYIVRRRLLHAAYAVSCGKTRIAAALEYGFDTYAGFYKAFQREFGCTLSEYLARGRARKPYRVDLFQEDKIMITHKQLRPLLGHWGLENETLQDIYYENTGEQNEHAWYVGSSDVLKCYADPEKLRRHAALSDAMARAGLAAATVIPTAAGERSVRFGELYVCLTRRLPGRQVLCGDLFTGNPAERGKWLGGMIGRLHDVLKETEQPLDTADLYGDVLHWALPAAEKILDLPDGWAENYRAQFGALIADLPVQAIHRDLNPGNIIGADDRWGFIDFELSEQNLRLFDPCYAATAVLSESFADEEKRAQWIHLYQGILAGYDAAAKLSAAERQAAPWVLLSNQLICVAWFAEKPQYAHIFEANLAMTRWLLERFEDLKLS